MPNCPNCGYPISGRPDYDDAAIGDNAAPQPDDGDVTGLISNG